jgi:imidazolonepropionase-like amidohydrolase
MSHLHRLPLISLLTILTFASAALSTGDATGSFALKGAKVYTGIGPPIRDAVIIVREGRFAEVGPNLAIPDGMTVYDLPGNEVIPGLVDEHSHIGGFEDVNEFPEPIGPENRAIDALNLSDVSWYEALKGGVTTVVTGPGSGERMGGQSVTIKTYGSDVKRRVLRESRELKMAVNARDLSHVASIRKTFYKALEYKEKWDRYNRGERRGPAPDRDLALEAVVPALEGEQKVRCHIHYANDIMTFLKLKDEFPKLDLTFIHTSEAYKVAGEIARRNVPVICLPLATRIAASEDLMNGLALLEAAGVRVSLHTDHPVVHEKLLRINAAMAIRYGVPEDAALRMVTVNPALSSRVQDRVGSIEKGKDADLVVLNGTWYEPKTRVEMVFVDGVLAYHRKTYEKQSEENRQ